jgi:hypothetical protein
MTTPRLIPFLASGLLLAAAPLLTAQTLIDQDFEGATAVASGKDTPIGATGWTSLVGTEPKQINLDGSGVLRISDLQKEKYFDAVTYGFETHRLDREGDGLRLEVDLKLEAGQWDGAHVVEGRGAIRLTLTHQQAGYILELPGGEARQVRVAEATDTLGGPDLKQVLARPLEADGFTTVSLSLTRTPDGVRVTGDLSGQAFEPVVLTHAPTYVFDTFAATVARNNHALLLDSVKLTATSAEPN